MENSAEDYRIQSFDLDTQRLLKTALKDPSLVNLEKVSNIIVDQSLKDPVFSKEAGRICYTIVQAEAKQSNGNVFRRHLLNRLQQEFKEREEMRARSLQEWVCYVTFICNIFDYLKVNNMPMVALVHPVYDCLMRLAKPDALMNEDEVRKISGESVYQSFAYKCKSPIVVFQPGLTGGVGLFCIVSRYTSCSTGWFLSDYKCI
ncbi:MIF4G domain-containing protein B-like [Astatotilapia calliptera]|uniref:MIF4G domain-containing protein n=1 Tax=Astatotilapia calliptera TaxID=8154 RepID=A0AAX7UY57_ASTCA|nr:MIF4G domain-containing protein B-like [Astatotilapia calliptera]XP_026016367.1 MIF4G domain-containing protein B-like [Astatotilapia calliptera]XP_026016368.1 MIF4G domain-containing protein B-like [Astatotilapia calliptera]